jgi:hypothetical protein
VMPDSAAELYLNSPMRFIATSRQRDWMQEQRSTKAAGH